MRADSAGEARSILSVIEQLSGFDDLKSQISNLKLMAESISKQIRGWTASLQDTKIEGQRYLNTQTKKTFENLKQRKEFEEMLKKYTRPQNQ